MGRQVVIVLYVLAMVAVVVGVDVLFFRHQIWGSTFVALVILGWGLCAGGLPGAGDGLDFRVGGLTWRVA